MADPRDKAFKKTREEILRRHVATQKAALLSVEGFLTRARAQVAASLSAGASPSGTVMLQHAAASVAVILDELGRDAGAAAADSATQGWSDGVDLVDKPIAAGGIQIASMVPAVDTQALVAIRTFLVGKMKGITTDAARKVSDELGLVILGAKNQSDAASAIQDHLGGATRSRALTVVRTEVGRAFSAAAQARKEQAIAKVPGLKKQWRRSRKIHPRATHIIADGQIRGVKESFSVGGEQLMYPRDPKARPKNTVNCGCTSLPYMVSWEVKHPIDDPLSETEIAQSSAARNVADAKEQGFKKWVQSLTAGRLNATGNVETAGVISRDILTALKVRGIEPATAEIALTDRRVLHMVRSAKKAGVPPTEISKLGYHLAKPKAVLLEQRADGPALIYTFDVPGTNKVAKVPVQLRDNDKKARVRLHNFITTATLVAPAELRKLELLQGAL